MATAEPMNHDDDVEHLFSWLQTPELRYREFAGAREITDTVIAWRAGAHPEAPENQDDGAAAEPAMGEISAGPEISQPSSHGWAARFGRSISVAAIPAVPEPAAVEGASSPSPNGTGSPRHPRDGAPAPYPRPVAAATGGGLLGGAYRGNGVDGDDAPAAEARPRGGRSLDAVFGRLAGGGNSLPDPRDRLRHIRRFHPPDGRSR